MDMAGRGQDSWECHPCILHPEHLPPVYSSEGKCKEQDTLMSISWSPLDSIWWANMDHADQVMYMIWFNPHNNSMWFHKVICPRSTVRKWKMLVKSTTGSHLCTQSFTVEPKATAESWESIPEKVQHLSPTMIVLNVSVATKWTRFHENHPTWTMHSSWLDHKQSLVFNESTIKGRENKVSQQ